MSIFIGGSPDKNFTNNPFEEECSTLATLETFDPNAFLADEKVPQELCNLVLAFSLVFNDLRDLYFASLLVDDCKPSGAPEYNRKWGHYAGLNSQVIRLIMGTVHELLNLIDEQQESLNHPFFRDVEMSLPASQRSDWREVVKIARGESSYKLGKLLLRIRNNASFHYDPTAIHRGFKNHFITSKDGVKRAYLSRGGSIQGSRCYFSDAAVEGLINNIAGSAPDAYATEFKKMLEMVCYPLVLIVTSFIQKRGFAFRAENTP